MIAPVPPALFTPGRFGSVPMANRLVLAPMTRCKSPGHVPNDSNVEYYRRRAAGGIGLILTEGTCIGHETANGYPDVPSLAGADALAGWKRVVQAVHSLSVPIVPQLWHVGSVRQAGMQPNASVPGVAPSQVLHPSLKPDQQEPQALTDGQIADLIAAYADAAREAKAVGFDAVEVHAAHGYLIDQFFWAHTNRRTDRYGGDFVDRTRFAAEVVQAVRAAVGPEFPICLRISQFKLGAYEAKLVETPEQLDRWLTPLTDSGVDLYHCSTRRFDTPEFEGSELNLAGWTKKLSGQPTISVGSVGLASDFISSFEGNSPQPSGLERLQERLQRDEFDLVGVGRALLADPHWPNKVREGRQAEIETFEVKHLETYP